MIKKLLNYLVLIVAGYMFLCLITPFSKILRNRSIENQINYLSSILDDGYDDELQERFPEGKLFSNCLLGLSIIEFCDKNGIHEERYAKLVNKCVNRIRSSRALSDFDQEIQLPYGAFYQGWSNLLYASYSQSILFDMAEDPQAILSTLSTFESRVEDIQSDSLRIIDTYADSHWPADNLVVIAALSNDSLKLKWIELIMDSGENDTRLIYHSGFQKRVIRGSSSAMITYFLNRAGYHKINDYNGRFEEVFIDTYCGMQLVKENENGSNEMDIDSGPVLFGYGASASVMNIKTQASLMNGNSKITWAVMNFISLPVNIFQKKYLLFKKEPMFDLFMLWSCTEF